jgi:hypothetical protein
MDFVLIFLVKLFKVYFVKGSDLKVSWYCTVNALKLLNINRTVAKCRNLQFTVFLFTFRAFSQV